jgi:hypothetical protein
MNEWLALRRCKIRKRLGRIKISWLSGEVHVDFEGAYRKLAESYEVVPHPETYGHRPLITPDDILNRRKVENPDGWV